MIEATVFLAVVAAVYAALRTAKTESYRFLEDDKAAYHAHLQHSLNTLRTEARSGNNNLG